MKRLWVLLCALLFALAFAATACEPGPFDDAVRDWNGENMQMRGFGGGAMPSSRTPSQSQ